MAYSRDQRSFCDEASPERYAGRSDRSAINVARPGEMSLPRRKPPCVLNVSISGAFDVR